MVENISRDGVSKKLLVWKHNIDTNDVNASDSLSMELRPESALKRGALVVIKRILQHYPFKRQPHKWSNTLKADKFFECI